MNKKIFNIEDNISIINLLSNKIEGIILIEENKIETIINKTNEYNIIINYKINPENHDLFQLKFSNELLSLNINAFINSYEKKINNNHFQEQSEGIIHSIKSEEFDTKSKSKYRAFYKINSSNFFLSYFENKVYETESFVSRGLLNLTINNTCFSVYTFHNDYLIIESDNDIIYDDFSEYCYNILIAIGFVSGKFFQDEVFIFDIKNGSSNKFCYNKLRNSSFSIYHSLTSNPYDYKHFIGNKLADKLYKKKILKSFTSENLSRLTELIYNNKQIQYSLVLFNESNSGNLSLLIKNNCFYIVLEVIKKFFYNIYKDQLPKDYSSKGNTDKYITLFSLITTISKDDENLLKDRNLYLHGDIEDLNGHKMVDDMHKQLTLIYRLILTYIGYDGYIIDHFNIRKNENEQVFIKCEPSTI